MQVVMVQFLSINFFLGFLQLLLGFSKVPVFCVTLYNIFSHINETKSLQMCRIHVLEILSNKTKQ